MNNKVNYQFSDFVMNLYIVVDDDSPSNNEKFWKLCRDLMMKIFSEREKETVLKE